jgi:hypothetical protein
MTLKPREIVQASLALILVLALVAQVVRGAGVPEVLSVSVGLALAFYFRTRPPEAPRA